MSHFGEGRIQLRPGLRAQDLYPGIHTRWVLIPATGTACMPFTKIDITFGQKNPLFMSVRIAEIVGEPSYHSLKTTNFVGQWLLRAVHSIAQRSRMEFDARLMAVGPG